MNLAERALASLNSTNESYVVNPASKTIAKKAIALIQSLGEGKVNDIEVVIEILRGLSSEISELGQDVADLQKSAKDTSTKINLAVNQLIEAKVFSEPLLDLNEDATASQLGTIPNADPDIDNVK